MCACSWIMLRISVTDGVLPAQACLEPTGQQQGTRRIRRDIALLGARWYCKGCDCMLDFNGVYTGKVLPIFGNVKELGHQLPPSSNTSPIEITECSIR